MLLAEHPKSPLRVLGIAAFEYLALLRGGTLGRQRRNAMAIACDFASIRDDYYDHKTLCRAEFRSLRRKLRGKVSRSESLRYTLQLRHAERNRPVLTAGSDEIEESAISYRTCVLDLTLQWLSSISESYVEPARYQSLLGVACLLQIADDLLDWEEDQALHCPGYVTAIVQNRSNAEVAIVLRTRADVLLQRTIVAARQDSAVIPFAGAAALTWAFIIALLHVRFPG